MRIQQLDVSCETKTKDNVFVHVVVSVQYQVIRDKVVDSFYKLTSQVDQIKAYVFDVVRSAVPKMNLDDVFISKEDIARDVKEQLTVSMETFGLSIIQTLLTDIVPAAKVKQAMNEINAALRMREAAVQKAEASKITVVKAAEADAEAKFLAGEGIARQRQAIVHGLRESVKDFNDGADGVNGISSREVISLMMVTQYFDTLRDLGAHGKANTLFIPHQPGAIGDITDQVRNGFLQAATTQEMTRTG